MLVFHKESTFTRLLQFALTGLGFLHQLVLFSENFFAAFPENAYHLVFIDCSQCEDAANLCR